MVSGLPVTIQAAQETADEAKGIAETAIQTVKVNNTVLSKSDTEVNITAIVGVDETAANGINVTKTSDNKVKVGVTPATYTSSTKTWTNESNVAKASDVKAAITDAVDGITIPTLSTTSTGVGLSASGHTVNISTANYTPASGDTASSWTNQPYLVTGATVEAFVGAETTKTLEAAKAYSDSLHTTSLDYVVLGDSETLPTASAATLGKIYLVKEGNTANGETNIDAISGSYVEYMTRKVSDTQYTWEKIGTTAADLSGYAKSVKINNNTSVTADNTTGVIDLSSYKWITHYYNSVAQVGTGDVPNLDSVKISDGGTVWGVGVIDATDTAKGLVTLSSTVDASNTGAVTGAGVASAISTAIGGIDTGVTGITVNGGSKQTGDVTLNVVTGFTNSTGYGGHDSDAIRVRNGGDGTYLFYAVVADSANRGVTYFYDKIASNLGSSTTATVSEKTVKHVYDTLKNKIPTTYVSSINSRGGQITLEAGGNYYNSTALETNGSQTNLWGLNVDVIENKQVVIDGFIGDESVYGKIGSFYNRIARLPAEATKVIGNFVYGSDGKVIDTIRAERMVSNLFGRNATGLTEWVADMPNLKDGNQCFRGLNNLTTFCGDLSSLTNGSLMFYETIALTSFIGDLSSLENGDKMFSSGPYSITQSSKLNSESVECILESIPDWTGDDEEHKLDIGVSTIITDESDVRQSIKDITGVELTATVGNTQEITYKGWTITFVVTE